MEERLTTSIVLYGDIDTKNTVNWSGFYNSAIEIAKLTGVVPNYVGITGESFKTTGIKTLKRAEKKILESFLNKSEIETIEIYSLKDDYSIAAFEYDVYICRSFQLDYPHILATFTNELYRLLDLEKVISIFKDYIDYKSGQVFQLSNIESPQIYAAKANDLSAFNSLKILKNL